MTARLKTSGATLIALWGWLGGSAAAQGAPIAAAIRSGDSAWVAGQFPAAREAYARVLALDSLKSSRSVYRLAVMETWAGDLKSAIPLFALYVRIEPRDEEGRIALAKAYAWSGGTATAVAIYDSILARDQTYRDAALGAARALVWGGKFDEALGRYNQWLARNPKDVEAGLARARSLAWAGRLKQSERAYTALGTGGENLESQKGIALVAAWRGDLRRSERLWRALTVKAPKDPEIWVGLAQVLRWSGRSEDARSALRSALQADPANTDAREQMRWVKAELGPMTAPTTQVFWDSDKNRSTLVSFAASFRPLVRTRFTATGTYRDDHLNASHGTAAGGRVGFRADLGTRFTATGEIGATRTSAGDGLAATTRTFTVGAARGTLRISSWFSLGGGATRYAFDETAAGIAAGVIVTSWSGEGELQLPGRLTLGGGGEVATLKGGTLPNGRHGEFGVLRWRRKRLSWLAVTGRAQNYDEILHDGYFSPSRYRFGEFSVHQGWGRDLGWTLELDGGLGFQNVRFDVPVETRSTQRAGGALIYRPRPGAEIALEYSFSNVASNTAIVAGAGSLYHANTLGLRARLIW